jgi:hypothetical protein
MNETLTIADLERRWEETLRATGEAVGRHPHTYREIKALVEKIVTQPLDINDYPVTAEKLAGLLKTMDDGTRKNIFHYYSDRISPASIGRLKLLRLECRDLSEQLLAFDTWRRETHRLRVLK